MSDALQLLVAARGKEVLTEVDERGATMLHHAASTDNVDVLEFLLDCGSGKSMRLHINTIRATN